MTATAKPNFQQYSNPPRDPRQAPRLTPEQVAKLAPQEKTAAHVGIHVQMMKQIEGEIAQAQVDAVRHGVELEGKFVAKPNIEDIVPFVVSTESAYLPDSLAESMRKKDQLLGFVLRDRATLAHELTKARLPHGAKVGSGSREERRAAAERMDKHPWSALGTQLSKRLRDGAGAEIANAHYVVVLGDQVLGSVFPFKFDLVEAETALAEAKAAKEADAAGAVAPAAADAAPEEPVLSAPSEPADPVITVEAVEAVEPAGE